MSDYWSLSLEAILDEHDIQCTEAQFVELVESVESAASVESDYAPPAQRPRDTTEQDLRAEVRMLRGFIGRVAYRLGVDLDPDSGTIGRTVPLGSSHSTTHTERV